jgi:tetratricopeptide (TPR) repeat protein
MKSIMKLGGVFLGVVLVLCCPAAVQAGLYNPCELDEGPFALDFMNPQTNKGFRETLLKMRSLAMDDTIQIDNPFRKRYVLVGETLAANAGKLTAEQKISLSEYLIRRRRPLEAKFLLLPLARQAGDNFILLSNLATACQQVAETKQQGTEKTSEYQQAVDYLHEALRNWPKTWEDLSDAQRKKLKEMYWTEENFGRCRTTEEYYLKLLRNRHREALRAKQEVETVDPLFGEDAAKAIRYVGDSGDFEPGKLADKEKAKLPEASVDRALQVVQQLLIWLPGDVRLYWQLGDLYNARGSPQDLRAARQIFDELVWDMKVPYKEVKDRRAALNDFKIPEDTGRTISLPNLEKKLNNDRDEASRPVDWRTLGIGFGSGVMVAIFALWQIREIRRRRQAVHSGR